MAEPNEALLDEHLAAENAHDLDRIMATYSAAPVVELNGTRIEGLAAVREFHRSFGFGGDEGSFSNVRVAERRRHRTGDAIVVEQTLTAVHTGTWRGVAPTGRPISIAVCTVYMFEGGRLAQESVYLDEGRLRHLLTKPAAHQQFTSSRDIILRTETFDAAVRFYGQVVGLSRTLDREGMVGFETGAFQLFVERGSPAHGPVFEMVVPDIGQAKERLVAAGCVVVEDNSALPRCYMRDPFGLVFNLERR